MKYFLLRKLTALCISSDRLFLYCTVLTGSEYSGEDRFCGQYDGNICSRHLEKGREREEGRRMVSVLGEERGRGMS